MSIVLDAMGSDNHPLPELQAASQLAQIGEKVILVGKKDFILQKSREIGVDYSAFEIVDAPDIVDMDETGGILQVKTKQFHGDWHGFG